MILTRGYASVLGICWFLWKILQADMFEVGIDLLVCINF